MSHLFSVVINTLQGKKTLRFCTVLSAQDNVPWICGNNMLFFLMINWRPIDRNREKRPTNLLSFMPTSINTHSVNKT